MSRESHRDVGISLHRILLLLRRLSRHLSFVLSCAMRLFDLPAILSLLAFTSALPTPEPSASPLPLIIWHGLGDRYDADGLRSTGKLAQKVNPGTYVYYIRTDEDGGNDRTNTFFGNITTQLADVCEAIHNEPKFLGPDEKSLRVDALGFSQGGQFLRGLIERCEGLSVRSLVTFGSQHNGIAQFQNCGTFDFLCKGATALVKGNAWTDYVQNKVVPAQYYRTVNETTGLGSDEYLAASNFLADVNNEREVKNETYAARIAALEKFVMFVFEEDITVIPKESGWFAEVNATTNEVTPLRMRKMYKEDWLGLKKLDERDGLEFKVASGAHMELDDEILRQTFEEYFGPERDPLLETFPTVPGCDCDGIIQASPYFGDWNRFWRGENNQADRVLFAQCVHDRHVAKYGPVPEVEAVEFQDVWDLENSWWHRTLWRLEHTRWPWTKDDTIRPLWEVDASRESL